MFLRKLLGSSNNDKAKEGANVPPPGMQTMGASLQRRFAKGVQYNMKIIIKGDRNVGKSCLFYRLQGQKFKEEYLPTDEIQVASIQWNYKATDDVVKVEVWDVVDKGKKKKKLDGLKLAAEDDSYEDACLDAEFIDVYKGTHGVIIVLDITKHWTYDYVTRELPKIPANIPVLILANHRDMGHHRTVLEDKVRYYIEELDRGKGAAQVRYAEASMRNGFGLKYIHKFFNLPFLQLQRETLLQQLETNTREIELTNEELDVHEESEEQNYDLFIDQLSNKRREQAEQLAEDALKEAKKRQDEERAAAQAAAEAEARKSKSVPATPVCTPVAPLPGKGPLGLPEAPAPKPIPGMKVPTTTSASSVPSTSAPTTPSTSEPPAEKPSGGFMSRLFGKGGKDKEENPVDQVVPTSENPVRNIDEFSPEEGLDASFLDDVKEGKSGNLPTLDAESSSDEEGGNPLVAGFQDDLDSEDDLSTPAQVTVPTETVELSSDDDKDGAMGMDQPSVLTDEDYTQETKITKSNSSPPTTKSTKNSYANSPVVERANNGLSKQSQSPHLSAKVQSVIVAKDDTLDSDSGDDIGNGVVILKDEDISEDETNGKTPQIEVEDEEESEEKNYSALQFEDLGILEKGFDWNTGLPKPESGSEVVSSSRQDTDTDGDVSATKKKKKKSKDKSKAEKDSSQGKKKKKSRDKEKDRESPDGNEKDKKKRKSKSKSGQSKKEMDDLEAFLGGGDVASPSGGGYESL